MIISNEFTVARPIEDTWEILTDLEGVAPCMPGAQLTEVEGDVYRGTVKVKLGPIQARFKGEATFVEQDPEAHRAVLSAKGKEAAGKGMASATVTAGLLQGEQEGTTRVSVETELNISGKIAQFGRSAMSDVSERLMAQFAQNLEQKLAMPAEEPSPSAESDGDTRPATAETGPAAQAAPTTPEAPAAADGEAPGRPSASTEKEEEPRPAARRVIDSPEAEPVDLVRTAGAPLAKWLVPVLVVVVIVVIIVVMIVT